MRVTACCFLFLPLFLFSQSQELDSLKLKAKLSVTGFFQGGNVQTLIFRTLSDVSYRPWRKWIYNTKNSYVYQAFGRKKADQDFLSLNFLYFNPEKKLYPQLIGIMSTNFRRRIRLRYLMGAGITYQVLNEKENWLKVSLSSEYEQTDFLQDNFNINEYDGNPIISTFRGTLWLSGKHSFVEKKLILTHESYVQPSLQRPNNNRWRVDLGLELPISKYLSFKINYVHTHESIVIASQRRDDRLLTFGLTVKSF